MTAQLFTNGAILLADRVLEDGVVLVRDGVIRAVTSGQALPADERIDLEGGFLSPGFIDLHVHGGDGADFMDATDEAVGQITSFHARNGTTALAATTLSGSRSDLHDAVIAIARAAPAIHRGAEVCGIHLEEIG